MMKVFLKGKNKAIELNNSDYLSEGGEGKIYVKNNKVFKICDSNHMIPEGKIRELSVLTDQHVVKPEDILVDSHHIDIGYTMKFIKNSFTLCQIFTKAFRTRNNITPEIVLELVRQMQRTIHHIHQNKILIVDLNEFNFLIDDKFKEVFFIDVNSYQTPSYAAMAIMDSIRDRQHSKFSQLTDWFSFAIVSFQMFVGIHPFKGKHPQYSDLDSRMLNNISIFNKEVGYPAAACQPFSVIPESYLKWYKLLFEKGERMPPPDDLIQLVHTVVPQIKLLNGKILSISKVRELDSDIAGYYHSSGQEVLVTKNKIYVGNKEFDKPYEKVNIGFTKGNLPIAAWLKDGEVKLKDILADKSIDFTCAGTNIMDYDGRLYIHNGMNIVEVEFVELKNKVLAAPHIVANVLENSTRFYSGVVIQNLFDAYYASFFTASKQCQQIALKELAHHRVIDAKYENKVLIVVGVDKSGHYNKFTFVFKENWNYEVREKKNITYTGVNFTVLDNGLCVHINEDENIEIFAVSHMSNIKVITDKVVSHDMYLHHRHANTLLSKDNCIYSITMNKS